MKLFSTVAATALLISGAAFAGSSVDLSADGKTEAEVNFGSTHQDNVANDTPSDQVDVETLDASDDPKEDLSDTENPVVIQTQNYEGTSEADAVDTDAEETEANLGGRGTQPISQ